MANPKANPTPAGAAHGSSHDSHDVPTWKQWLLTTDHKKIGLMYMWTAFGFFLIAGLAAVLFRTELLCNQSCVASGGNLMSARLYYTLFSFHGTAMIFLWIIPVFAGFGNYLVPLLIGAPDMAYPRLNALSYWTYLAAAVIIILAFALGSATGWTAYPPLSSVAPVVNGAPQWLGNQNADGGSFFNLGLQLVGVSSMMGAINFLVTIIRMRAPGITFHNMSLFVWAQFTTALLITFATPMIGDAMVLNFFDRELGTHFFTAVGSSVLGGDPVMYQNLFWFYSHPAVYVMILPAFGIVSEVMPRMVRRPIFGYHAMAYSILAIAFLGFIVWAHHMFTTGIDPRVRMGFMLTTMIIGVPTGVKIFNWLATLWGGDLRFSAPLLWCVGFIGNFVIGGIDGVFMASIPVDYELHMTYWVVSHIHYVLFGGAVMGVFAGIYYWWPRFTGRMYNRQLALWHFWLTLIGLNVTFMTMHFTGLAGMPRRVFTYDDTFTLLNQITTIGAYILAIGQLPFLANVAISLARGTPVSGDPWNDKQTIEWRGFVPKPGARRVVLTTAGHEPSSGGGAE
ncbi:MAG: cytochrome c oxidase subunit I [Thermoplasmatota archaeon]